MQVSKSVNRKSSEYNSYSKKKLLDLIDKPESNFKTINSRKQTIFDSVIKESVNNLHPDFTKISWEDVDVIYKLYDSIFFEDLISKSMAESGYPPLKVELSRRMLSTAGQVTWRKYNSFILTIGIDLILKQFTSNKSPITVGGLVCKNRLEVLQRIIEHELIHLIEFLVWESSDDKNTRFHSLAKRLFDHKKYTHELLSWRDHAEIENGITLNCHVSFIYEGQIYWGIVTKITKRATILVRDIKGRLYSDSKRYTKYYVPTSKLHLIN